jgi:diguanylate cyclase (GGDEF)-like protein
MDRADGTVRTSEVTKRSLLALSHAMERYVGAEVSHDAPRLVLGLFQRRAYFEVERERYAELASTGCVCLVGFVGPVDGLPEGVVGVSLPEDHPLSRVWTLIALGGAVGTALTATDTRDLAPYEDSLEASRLFRATWTFSRDSALADAAALAAELGPLLGPAAGEALAGVLRAISTVPSARDDTRIANVTEQLVASLDRAHRRTSRLRAELAETLTASEHDVLTRLPNRRFLERFLGGPADSAPVTIAVLLVDVDKLKVINDIHGHAAGDAALVAVADCLRRHSRPVDVVARFAGDEFVVLLPGLGPEDALDVADRMVTAVSEQQMPEPWPSVRLSVSVGVAEGAATKVPLEVLDRALYEAKRSGRGHARLATAG